jgi:uncharacterized protein
VELEHRFELPVGIDKAFPALLDLDVVGPCFPGATVDSVNGDEFTGSVKIKIGPVPLNYKGTAKFVEKDYTHHRAVIEANGASARRGSTATMLVNASATEIAPNRTAVKLLTTLAITGRDSNFGRQAMIDVGNELIGRFADSVSKQLAGKKAGGATLLGVVNPDAVAAEVSAAEHDGASPAAGSTPRATAADVDAVSAARGRRAASRRSAPASPPIQVLKATSIKQIIPAIAGAVLALLILLKKKKPKVVDALEDAQKEAEKAAKELDKVE